jgi:hypothetical protein
MRHSNPSIPNTQLRNHQGIVDLSHPFYAPRISFFYNIILFFQITSFL